MSLAQLTPEEREVVFRCLRAAAEGPFFDDDEFHPLFGLHRVELASIVSRWPAVNDSDEDTARAINNSFAHLLWYPHYEGKVLFEMMGVDDAELERIFNKWRSNE